MQEINRINQLLAELNAQLEKVKVSAASLTEDGAIAILKALDPQYQQLQSLTEAHESILPIVEAKISDERFEAIYPLG